MEMMSPIEKILVALKAIDYQRKLFGRDDQVIPIPVRKFFEEGLNEPHEIKTILGRLEREGIIKNLMLFSGQTFLLPSEIPEAHMTYKMTINPKKFDGYYAEMQIQAIRSKISTSRREEQKSDVGNMLKGAGIEYDTETGNFKYRERSGCLGPTKYQGKALILFLKNINKPLHTKKIGEETRKGEMFQPSDVHDTITNLRRKIGLSRKKLKREHNFYTLVD